MMTVIVFVQRVYRGAYLEDEALRAGELVVPHGLVHEQEEQAGQEGQSDEDQAGNLGGEETQDTLATNLNATYRQQVMCVAPY